jgi:diaminopimelate decarboxylase
LACAIQRFKSGCRNDKSARRYGVAAGEVFVQKNVLCVEDEPAAVRASAPMSLRPILDPAISETVYSSPATLLELVARFGSPLNIVWPHILTKNVEAIREVLRAHRVRFEIYYGAKVNKSQALVCAAAASDVGVDVSSVHEMRDALQAGVHPSRLCATGPAKTKAFHAELLASGSLISIDSIQELNDLEECSRAMAPMRRARVLLRYRPASSHASRFGMGAEDLMPCLCRLARGHDRFAFEGFHFHLSGYAYETRVRALQELARFIEAARSLGLAPKMIDIGGGLPIRYVENEEYETFLQYQCEGHYRTGKIPGSFYPYGSRTTACEWLELLLTSPCVGGLSVAEYFDAMNLVLAIEPGRSLVDQAAISVFRITRVKPLASGKYVIFVEGSSFSACETWFASEFLIDPILVSIETAGDMHSPPVHAYIAGHSCLDDDVITNRLICFERMPKRGDLLVYANTAGYQMDLLENEFHRYPMPRRIAVSSDAAGQIHVSPDDRMEQ